MDERMALLDQSFHFVVVVHSQWKMESKSDLGRGCQEELNHLPLVS